MVSENPPISSSDRADRFRDSLFLLLLRLGVLSLVEVPNARSSTDDKISTAEDKSQYPKNGKEVEVPESSNCVIPFYICNWPVSSFFNISY